MSDYPIPGYAVTLWVAGDNLMVNFPGTVSEKSHTIKLPASAAGLGTAISILKDRAHAVDLRLSNKGTPTQYQVENDKRYIALVKARREEAATKRREKAEAEKFLKELGL